MTAPGLADLAADPRLLNGLASPSFPASLLTREHRFFAALASGDRARADRDRAELVAAIEALSAQDRARLAALGATRSNRGEHDFLRARLTVLDVRLKALRRDDVPVFEAVASREKRAPVSPAPGHRNDIQGLRAIAVLLVALAHSRIGFLSGGFVGVDVFFVLSGFLITGLLVGEARRRRWVSLVDFYLRRARRILPAATLTLLVTDVAAYHLLNFVRAKQYVQDSIASVLFAANVHFASQGTDYFAQGQPPSPVQHFWSLAVEEQFYVVWPLLFILVVGLALRRHTPRPRRLSDRALGRTAIVVGAIALGSLAWSVHDTAAQPAGAYFSTFARAWELALGALLALGQERVLRWVRRWRWVLGWVGLAAIVAAAVAYSAATPFPGYAALVPTLGAALVILAGAGGNGARISVGRVLGLRPLRYIGDRSYAFYLWHWPVLVIAEQHAGHQLSVASNLLLLLGAFALSVVSYRLVEQPIRTAAWARAPQALAGFACAVITVIVVATAITTSISNREAIQTALAAPVSRLIAPSQASTAPAARQATAPTTNWIGGELPAVVAEVQGKSAPVRDLNAVHPAVGHLLDDYAQDVPVACSAHNTESSSEICQFGRPSSSRRLVVIGDSHADMWMPAVIPLGAREGWDVVPLLKSGCGPTDWQSSSGPSDCQAWWRWAVAQMRTLDPDVTLVAGFYNWAGSGRAQMVLTALDGDIRTLQRRSRRLVLVGDTPERVRQPVDCLLSRRFAQTGCTETLAANQAALTGDVARVAADDHVGFIDPTGWFCYLGQCPLVVGNIVTYRDNAHVSQTYAQALSGTFGAALHAVLRQRP